LPADERSSALTFLNCLDEYLAELQLKLEIGLMHSFVETASRFIENGVMSVDQALRFQEELVDYCDGLPEVEKRLSLKRDQDGWLKQWLARHPSYVESHLNGALPDWVEHGVQGI
jgi:hypothetical protein